MYESVRFLLLDTLLEWFPRCCCPPSLLDLMVLTSFVRIHMPKLQFPILNAGRKNGHLKGTAHDRFGVVADVKLNGQAGLFVQDSVVLTLDPVGSVNRPLVPTWHNRCTGHPRRFFAPRSVTSAACDAFLHGLNLKRKPELKINVAKSSTITYLSVNRFQSPSSRAAAGVSQLQGNSPTPLSIRPPVQGTLPDLPPCIPCLCTWRTLVGRTTCADGFVPSAFVEATSLVGISSGELVYGVPRFVALWGAFNLLWSSGDTVITKTSWFQPLVKLVNALEVFISSEQYSDIGGLDRQIQKLIEAVVLPTTQKDKFKNLRIHPPKSTYLKLAGQ
ncbi:conserved hypothetical protein [Culex quinquefasciatus]|uniref:Uncharacterized protein n=1 Tax=Culex quinquefasciatus TaxID=7176 RepID=B0X2B3_CULQU|nr:conserved hypothetical protein [Culex quinquefasciatus]|eukprot:XP_001863785.1 conserved hypothetical protein [Culex quinquefasciatus]